ncbi:MAG TPA: helix-turn-helix domain-containing protein [Candidatus Merdenecus merdavium]|nr:helix-turn-helix domain-containing protein [Candidatus Merdenecus merdavium]
MNKEFKSEEISDDRNEIEELVRNIADRFHLEGNAVDNETIFKSSAFMEKGQRFSIYMQSNGESVKDHKHDYIELNYVYRGAFKQVIEGNEVLSREGDVCIFDMRAVHSVESLTKESILINILMKQEFFDSAFLTRISGQGIVSEFLVEAVLRNRKKEHYLYFPSHKNKAISVTMENILIEYDQDEIGKEEVLSSYMVILFTQLLRNYQKEQNQGKGEKKEVMVLKILAYIEEHYMDCTLKDTAEAFGFHPHYLSDLLKKTTGISFLAHVQNQKLEKSKAYLRNTDLSIAQIATLCGYQNINFFYRLFEKKEKETPGNYRKKWNL